MATFAPRRKPSDDELLGKGIGIGGLGSMESAMATAGQEQGLADVEQTRKQGAALNQAWDAAEGKTTGQMLNGPWAPVGVEPASGPAPAPGATTPPSIGGGRNSVSNENGSVRTTSGSPFPQPGSTLLNAGNSAFPGAVPVTRAQLGGAGNQMGTTRGNGFEFHGTAADAAKFNAPVGGGPAMVPTGRMIQAVSTSDFLPKPSGVPTPTAVPSALDLERMNPEQRRFAVRSAGLANDAYLADTQRMNAGTLRDNAALREEGDTNRALITAQGVAGHTAVQQQVADQQARQFQAGAALRNTELEGKQIALGDVKAMNALKESLMKGDPNSPEYQANYMKYAAMSGKNEKNFGTLDQVDPETGQRYQVLFNNASGNVINPKGAALQAGGAFPAPTKEALDYLKAHPETKAEFERTYGVRP